MLDIQDLSQSIDAAFESYDPIDFYATESTKKDSNKLYKQLNKEIHEISKNAKRAYKNKEYKECIKLCDEGIKITDRYLGMIPELVSAAKETGQLKREAIASVVMAILRALMSVAVILVHRQFTKKMLGSNTANITSAMVGVQAIGGVGMDAYAVKKNIDALKEGKSINFNFLQTQIKTIRDMFTSLKDDAKAAMDGNPATEALSGIFVTGLNDIAIEGSILGGLIAMGYDDIESCEMYVDCIL